MSYEGEEQHICARGHRYEHDCYLFNSDETSTCSCGALSVFCNSVDHTNGEANGIMLKEAWDKLLLTEETTETCAIYRVPTAEEHASLRSYYDETSLKYRPLSEHPLKGVCYSEKRV